MLIIAAKITVKPKTQEAFVQATRSLIAETRKEKGNLSYNLYASTENSVDFMFYENWADKDAFDAHLTTAHYNAFGKYLEESGCLASPIDLKVHVVED